MTIVKRSSRRIRLGEIFEWKVSAVRLVSGLSIVLLLPCALFDPSEVLGGESSGRVSIQSLTLPGTEILTLTKNGEPTTVWGELNLPREVEKRVPLVIILHGRGGVAADDRLWSEGLNRAGFASFLLDSFTARELRSSELRSGRSIINMGSRIIDVYRALEFLASHPAIDPARIALLGFSQGGNVAMWARQKRFQALWMSSKGDFAAYLAFYPGFCATRKLLDEHHVSDAPLQVFVGTADDQVPIEPCREYVERVRRAGKRVSLIEYPGAYHAFDRSNLPALRFDKEVISARNCTFIEVGDGKFSVFHRSTGEPANPKNQCVSYGIRVGYNLQAHQKAISDVKMFLYGAFKPAR